MDVLAATIITIRNPLSIFILLTGVLLATFILILLKKECGRQNRNNQNSIHQIGFKIPMNNLSLICSLLRLR